MFRTANGLTGGLRLRGKAGELRWHNSTAVVVGTWTVQQVEQQWVLSAQHTRVDKFQARQSGLMFVAPRAGGFWCWPVESLSLGDHRFSARLGPPEQ